MSNEETKRQLALETLNGDASSFVVLKDMLEQEGEGRLVKKSKRGRKTSWFDALQIVLDLADPLRDNLPLWVYDGNSKSKITRQGIVPGLFDDAGDGVKSLEVRRNGIVDVTVFNDSRGCLDIAINGDEAVPFCTYQVDNITAQAEFDGQGNLLRDSFEWRRFGIGSTRGTRRVDGTDEQKEDILNTMELFAVPWLKRWLRLREILSS